jgi:putative spermidine/putrescine transport system substrate-binding protein
MKMPADVAAQFLPDSDYARAGVVDYQHMAAVQEAFSARYLSEVK